LIYVPGRTIKIPKEEKGNPTPGGGREKMVIPAKLFCKNIVINLSNNDFYPYIRPY
jgi:hypothetical protein